jgi:hypothetical protein
MSLNYQAAVRITAEYSGEQAVNKAKRDFKEMSENILGIKAPGEQLKEILKGVGAALAVERVFEYGKRIVETGEQLKNLSTTTGISVEALDQLKGAAEDNGVQFDALTVGLKKFTVNLALAQAGVPKALAGFQAAGIEQATLKTLSASEALYLLSDRLSKFDEPAKKAAVSAAVFGRGVGVDMARAIGNGREELEKLGSGFTTDFAEKAKQVADTFKELGREANKLSVSMISDLLPAIADTTKALADLAATRPTQDGQLNTMNVLGEAIRQIGASVVAFGELFGGVFDTIKVVIIDTVETVKLLGKEIYDLGFVFDALGQAIDERFDDALDSLKNYYNAATKDAKDFYSNSSKAGNDFIDGIKKRSADYVRIIGEVQKHSLLFGDGKSPAPEHKDGLGNDPGNIEALNKEHDAHMKAVEKEREALAESAQMGVLERERINLSTAAYEKKKIAIEENFKAQKAVVGFSQEERTQYLQVTDAIIAQKQALIDFKEQQKQSFGAGAQEALKEYAEKAKDTAMQTKQLFLAGFQGIEDALVKFVKTGKLSFQDLANTIEEMLIRIAIRKALVLGIEAATGTAFASGGVMTGSGPMPLHKYANGGVANKPQMALFGEGSTPEAFVPLPDGRSIPVTMQGRGGSGQSNHVEVNVTVASGGAGQADTTSDSDKGRQLGVMISNAVTSELLKQKRPGGILA